MCEEITIQQLLPKQSHNPKIFNTCNCETASSYSFTFVGTTAPKERDKQMIEMRKNGATYQQIAEAFGVSRQRIAFLLGKNKESQFRTITEKQCAYTGIRNWLNTNKISMTELVRRIYGVYHAERRWWLGKYLTKQSDIKKTVIDKILEVTGLTYEQAFMI